MVEEKIAGIMRDFVKTMAKGDVERTLSFFTEDGVWVTPNGTFKNKKELRRYVTWMSKSMSDTKVTETGNRIITHGNRAFYEHVISGTIEGVKVEGLALCAYEFKDGKIKETRTVWDRLSMSQQVASGKGWLAKWLVNLVVKQAEKGLH